MISSTEVKQTSQQTKAHLLCAQCEARFGRNDEDWVIRSALKNDGSFKLFQNLRRYTYVLDASRTAAIYRAAEIPEVNVSALAYFASSIFWRGAAHFWKVDGARPVPLGPYEEPLRKYLMGEADFPKDMVLTAVVRRPSPVSYLHA